MDTSCAPGAKVRFGHGNLDRRAREAPWTELLFRGLDFYGPSRIPEELVARMQPTNLGDRCLEHKKSPYDLSRYQTQPRVEVDQHAAKRIGRLITAAGRQARPFLNVYTHRLCVCLSRASGQGCLLPHRSSLVPFGRIRREIFPLLNSLPLHLS
jgi:hypothetical protein